MNRRNRVAHLAVSLGIFLAGGSPCPGAPASDSKRAGVYDCGTLALRQLLKLEGLGGDLRQLEARLPAPRADGYSMKELRDASLASGLRLTGVLLKKDTEALDRPMLVFVKRGPHGHYLVVRPVGRTGKSVQVLDPIRPATVMDKIELLSSPEWTGLSLVPDRPPGVSRFITPTLAALTIASLVAWRWMGGRKDRAPLPSSPPATLEGLRS